MGIHAVSYYHEPDAMELVDVDYQCSWSCMVTTLERECALNGLDHAGTQNLTEGGSVSWGTFPCGSETDYDVFCSECGDLLWKGLQSD